MDSKRENASKVILIGDSGVGKSSLMMRFTTGMFDDDGKPTIGVEFGTRALKIDGKMINLQIWDTAGQERYRAITSAHYRGACGFVLVFDVTKKESFDNLKRWLDEIGGHTDGNVKVLLVGNKCDMAAERVIDYDEGKKFADSMNLRYLETSVKNSINIEQTFTTMLNGSKEVRRQSPIPIVPASVKESVQEKPLASTVVTDPEYDYVFKLVLVGDSGVGKTCLLTRLVRNDYKDESQPTIGIEFATHQIQLDGKMVKLQIWDTAGQERYRAITSSYYRNAMAAIIVFDITKQETFDNVTQWIKEIEQYAEPNGKKLLIGNKCDLSSARKVEYAKAQTYATTLNISYFETSAKDSTSVDTAFLSLAREIMSHTTPKLSTIPSVDLTSHDKPAKKSSRFF